MKQRNNLILLAMLFAACLMIANGQSYPMPENLSSYDLAQWIMRNGQIATGTATPTVTAFEGALYINNEIATAPQLWRYGTDWQLVAGGGDGDAFKAHVASQTDPHGASMTVSQQVTIGDPDGVPFAGIDSPIPGQMRIASYVVLIGLDTAPTAVEGGFYYNSTAKHFYISTGTAWQQLDN